MKATNQTPVSRNAKHILTDEEVESHKEALLAALQAKKEIEAEKKEVANTYKTKIAEQELAIDKVSNLLRVGYEIRPFQCYLVKNFEDGRREYYEFGTDRLVDTEPLNAADYQTEIDMQEETIRLNNEAAENNVKPIEESTEVEETQEANPFGGEEPMEAINPEATIETPKKGGSKKESVPADENPFEIEEDVFEVESDDSEESDFPFDI